MVHLLVFLSSQPHVAVKKVASGSFNQDYFVILTKNKIKIICDDHLLNFLKCEKGFK